MDDELRETASAENARSVKRLYRSRRERMVGGVCGGLAEYVGTDPTLVRIAFVVLSFVGGWGIIAYIIGLIVIPESPGPAVEEGMKEEHRRRSSGFIWGLLLIIGGLILLLHNYDVFPWPLWWFWSLSWRLIWPLIFVLIGIALLLSRGARKANEVPGEVKRDAEEARRLTRSRKERMVGGVCGGVAVYFRLDPTLVRLIWAFGTIVSHGLGVVAYIILLIVLAEEDAQPEQKS